MNGYNEYRTTVEACLHSAAVCNHCASACLKEEHVQMMTRCIQLTMECAAVCYATAQVLSMGGTQARAMVALCAQLCDACSMECAKHDHRHCRQCSDICHNCANQCRTMLAEAQPASVPAH